MAGPPRNPKRSDARRTANEAMPVKRTGTIALLGRPNVGKSTLLNALLGERIAITSHHPQTTRDRIAGILTKDETQFVFLDTPGVHAAKTKLGERMNHLAKSTANECDVVLFMADVDAREGQEPRVSDVDWKLLETIPATKPVVLLLNEIDRITPRSRLLPFLSAFGELRAFTAVVPISALRLDGVDRILEEISRVLPEGEHAYADDELSDKPVRFFIAEFVREQVLKRTRQEVPHGVAVTVESFEEGPKLVRISVTVHVAKESHKAILIGDGGKMLTAIGTAARLRAEQMLGNRVHLQTWIRTTPGWFDDAAKLEELGYVEEKAERAKRNKKKRTTPRSPTQKHRSASAGASSKTKAPKEAGGSTERRSTATKHV